MQQIQQLCGADETPQLRMNTGDSQFRDPYLTHVSSVFSLAFSNRRLKVVCCARARFHLQATVTVVLKGGPIPRVPPDGSPAHRPPKAKLRTPIAAPLCPQVEVSLTPSTRPKPGPTFRERMGDESWWRG